MQVVRCESCERSDYHRVYLRGRQELPGYMSVSCEYMSPTRSPRASLFVGKAVL
jgi:hypothetical protein